MTSRLTAAGQASRLALGRSYRKNMSHGSTARKSRKCVRRNLSDLVRWYSTALGDTFSRREISCTK